MRSGGVVAYLAIGSNLGDREGVFGAVVREVEASVDVELVSTSSVFETEPVGPAEQGRYLNAAFSVQTWLSPIALLRQMQRIELLLGRDRDPSAQRWGPRTVDLDLLFFGDRCIVFPDLIVPHPRLHERAFVLAPLIELAPDFEHPVLGRTVAELAESLGDLDSVAPWPAPAGWPRTSEGP